MKPLPTYQKLRGGYYTPEPIADFMSRWAIQDSNSRVLEPSCGDGIFLEAAVRALVECGTSIEDALNNVQGVELDEFEGQKAYKRINQISGLYSPSQIRNGDFFAYCQQSLTNRQTFDVVLGNPPLYATRIFQNNIVLSHLS